MSINYFDITRFFSVLKIDLIKAKSMAIVCLIPYALYIFVGLLSAYLFRFPLTVKPFLVLSLLVAPLSVSIMFSRLHDDKKAVMELLIPASSIEKFLSKLLIATVFYFLATLIFAFFASFVLMLLSLPVLKEKAEIFSLLKPFISFSVGEFSLNMSYSRLYLIYITVMSFFFFGAVFFKKHHVIYTVLFILLVSFVFGIISRFLAALIMPDLFTASGAVSAYTREAMAEAIETNESVKAGLERVSYFVGIYFNAILPLVFYIISYFTLTDMER